MILPRNHCKVRRLGFAGFGDAWTDWCSANWSRYYSDYAQCARGSNGKGYEVGYTDPWTWAGITARGGDINKKVQEDAPVIALPSPSEYEPDILFRTAVYNWPRFVVLMGYASTVLSLGNPIVGLATVATLGPNPAAAVTVWTTLPMLAIPYAIGRGGDRLHTNVMEPLGDLASDTFKIAFGALSGNWQAETLAFFARRAAKNIQGTDPFWSSIRGAILAVADNAPDVLIIAKNPQAELSQSGRWTVLGQGIKRVADTFPLGEAKSVAYMIGDVLIAFAPSLAELVKNNPDEAINKCTVGFGLPDLRTLAALGDDTTQTLLKLKNATNQVGLLERGMAAFEEAFNKIRAEMKGIGTLDGLIQWIDRAWNDFNTKVWSKVKGFVDAAIAAGRVTPGSAPTSSNALPTKMTMTKSVQLTTAPTNARTMITAEPTSKTPMWLVGAGAGFFVGGGVGALVGAGAALVLKGK